MLDQELHDMLVSVAAGRCAPEEALRQLRQAGGKELGFARIDTDRVRRTGMPEVIYGPGKTVEQLLRIVAVIHEAGQRVLATRVSVEQARAVLAQYPQSVHHELARCLTLDAAAPPPGVGLVAVICAGTADVPVAEEAALVAEWMGARVERIFDAGVAGLHRVLKHLDVLRRARALVVVAGMEGALPSVVGGLVDRPIIAVPTSVGYGMNLGGVAALLAMLNSCAPGVAVVNVDNGFGAGVAAARINRVGEPV